MNEIDERVFGDARPDWIGFFQESPVEALDELFTNTYYHGPLNAVEPEHLLLDWTSAIDSEVFYELLDSSIAEWIKQRWNENSPSIEPVDLMWQRALRVTAMLDSEPRKAIAALYLRQSSAITYLGPLVRNRACDPLGWYWASVSRIQPDERLVQQWFRLCNLVPGTPVFHGTWGLLGLQRAPGADKGGFRVGVAVGLERYLKALNRKVEERSLGHREAEYFALSGIRDLRRRYPFPNRWREYWSSDGGAELSPNVRRWITAVFGKQVFQRVRGSAAKPYMLHKPKRSGEWIGRSANIATRLRRAGDRKALSEARELLDEERSYSRVTGDSYDLVRTLCRFSSLLVKRDTRIAREWAEEAIEWEPWNPYCWTAVIVASRASGDIEGATRLSYEAIDRFPNNAVVRNGLAELLRAAGRPEEAEAIYRATAERFPDDAVARTGLAGVLRAAGRLDEAEVIYRATAEQFPGNVIAHTSLADALRAAGRPDEAEATYRATAEQFPDDTVAPNAVNDISRRVAIRADMRRALILKGEERNRLLRRLISATDALLRTNSHDVDALYTKAEALLALGDYQDTEALLASLPPYVVMRPDFRAMQGRLQLARLIASRPQPFDEAVVQSIVTPWNAAARSAVELRGVEATARLRAVAAMVDGAALHELRESATVIVSQMIARQSKSNHPVRESEKLTTWWVSAIRNAIVKSDAREDLTYDEIAPELERHASFLDTLDDELVSASRYVYTPK
jgi:tetratricopeptide (TPR) repeat protein